jgi:Tol biopolymer transport system component
VEKTVEKELPRVTPFLVGEGVRKQPAWSPTADLIAYVSDEAGADDIWISDLSGAKPLNLTSDYKGVNTHPAWSPDGKQLAFFSDRDDGGVFVMSALGGGARKVVAVRPEVHYTFHLQWAGNGDLVYTNYDEKGRKQVYRVTDLNNPKPECLTAKVGASVGMSGALTPDGLQFVFSSSPTGVDATLFIGDLVNGGYVELDKPTGPPSWGPGGKVYFVSTREGVADLWGVAVDADSGRARGKARRLTSGLGLSEFSFNSKGDRLIAAKLKRFSRLWSFPAPGGPVTTLEAGRPLTSAGFEDEDPVYLKGEKKLLFTSNRRGSQDIWKVSPDGGAPTRVTTGPDNNWKALVHPDGGWVGLSHTGERGISSWVMRRDGGGLRPLLPRPPDDWQANMLLDWSPDGRRALVRYMVKNGRDGAAVVPFDPAGGTVGEPTLLDLPGSNYNRARWSPDGSRLAFDANIDGAWRLGLAGKEGQEPRILPTGRGDDRNPVWSPDGKYLYFMRDFRGIWRLSIEHGEASGEPELWAEFPRTRLVLDCLNFTDDQAILSVVEEASDLWLVDFPQR